MWDLERIKVQKNIDKIFAEKELSFTFAIPEAGNFLENKFWKKVLQKIKKFLLLQSRKRGTF